MSTITNQLFNVDNILKAIAYHYPNSLCMLTKFSKTSYRITMDINDKTRYHIDINANKNTFGVMPSKLLFKTFEMNAKAANISNQIKEYVENGSRLETISDEVPMNCPHCKNPNSKMVRECEWCGNQII